MTRSRGATSTSDQFEGSSTLAVDGTGQQQPRTPGHLTPVTSPLPAAPRTPKKSTDSMEHTEHLIPPLAQTPIEVSSSAAKQEERETIEHQQSKLPEESSVLSVAVPKIASSPTTTAVPSVSSISSIECVNVDTPPPSVIHSTGNVEKITTVQSVTPAVSPSVSASANTSSSELATCSPSVISISTMAATVAPPSTSKPVFSSSAITSPTYQLQDIPNISERIHHSATALKLKTGKGYFFESTSGMPICSPSVSSSLESPAITAITPSVLSPPASVSPKVTEVTPISVASTVPSVSPITGSQSITIKAKTQPPIGPSMSQLVTTSEMWPLVSTSSSISKTSVCTVPSTFATVHTPSPFSESSIESTGIVQPPPAHVSKLTITPPSSDLSKQGVVTSHQSILASSSPISVASTIPNKPSKPLALPSAAGVSQPQVPLLPPEMAAHFGAFPPHLLPGNPHLSAEYMSNAANQQHLSIIQKQQAANRTLKSIDSRSSPGFVSPAPHLPPADVQAAFNVGLPHLRPQVPGQSPMLVPRPGFSGLSPEMEMLTQQQIFAMYPHLSPELRQNGPTTLSRHQLSQIPRQHFYPGLPYPGLSQEQAMSELAKDSVKLQQLQQHHQQQQLNSGKKDDNHHRAVAQSLAEEQHKQHHSIVDPAFHLQDPSTMGPSIGQRNMSFSGRIFPFSMAQPDRFVSPELMHPLYGMNGQGRPLPVPTHNFAGSTSNPTDLSKPGANQTSTTPEPLKRSNTLTKPSAQEAAYLSQMHRQMTSPSGIATPYRKDLPTVQEPSAELLRSQMAAMAPGGGSLPLNMSSQLSQRPPSRTSIVVQPAHPSLSRASESPMAEQALVVNKPSEVEPQVSAIQSGAVSTLSTKTLRDEQQLQQAALHDVQANNSDSIMTKHPVLWSGLLALKNESVSVQMHFVSGNRDISLRALPSFNEINQPLRITQRMRLDQQQLTALERKILANEDFCMLVALPCGRDSNDVITQSDKLRLNFITYMQSKQAAGIVNTNDETVNCQYYI